MSDLTASVSSVLPNILAAAGLILLGVSFIHEKTRCRNEERRLREAIRSLREAESTESNTGEKTVQPGEGEV